MTPRSLLTGTVLALALSAAALWLFAQVSSSASASTGSGCSPSPGGFEVPGGHRAVRFRVAASRPGRTCSPGGGAVEGLSIRSGGATLFVSYREEGGRSVSDPMPLGDLTLGPGRYTLLAAPGEGATVTLAWELQEARR